MGFILAGAPRKCRSNLISHVGVSKGARRRTDTHTMGWQQAVETTVTGLGYELVDVEHAARGLLRVTIDRVPGQVYHSRHGEEALAVPDQGEFVTVEDCEQVTRQLKFALEVEGLDYQRLEVSSPGLDRPLRREADFQRFAGREVSLALKLPFQGRKSWRGVLEAADTGWRIVFKDGKVEQALDFAFDEVREARLVPVVDFKRKDKGGKAKAVTPAAATGVDGGLDQ